MVKFDCLVITEQDRSHDITNTYLIKDPVIIENTVIQHFQRLGSSSDESKLMYLDVNDLQPTSWHDVYNSSSLPPIADSVKYALIKPISNRI